MLDWPGVLSDVIVPTLRHLKLDSPAAQKLVLGTAIYESTISDVSWFRQKGGPALGLYQTEPDTDKDVWENFLRFRPELRRLVEELISPYPDTEAQLIGNLYYSTSICRLVYYRRKEPLPVATDLVGLSVYYKNFYNTPKGRGSAKDWLERFLQVKHLF